MLNLIVKFKPQYNEDKNGKRTKYVQMIYVFMAHKKLEVWTKLRCSKYYFVYYSRLIEWQDNLGA